MPDVLIVEDYVPEYRKRFFEMLEAALAQESIRLTVAVSDAETELAARRDAAEAMPFVRYVPTRSVSIAGRRLTLRSVSHLAAASSLVIVDQAFRHLENYILLLRQGRGPKIALWGHGSRRVKPATPLARLAERRVTRAAHWFFAYTAYGADQVAESGFPREHITVTRNTTDVRVLATLRDEIRTDEMDAVREELGLPERNVCLFVGALDPSKRIEFLLESASTIASRVPGFVLVLSGDGPTRSLVMEAAGLPWLRYVGRVSGRRKAMLGAVSDLLLMPGSVGLVAVDSFALKAPIVTTQWPYHGPEVDYLIDGVNARISNDDVVAYADVVERLLLDREELARLKAGCAAATREYTLETMVENFTRGVIAALQTPRR